MADLLDDDGGLERRLLGVVPFKMNASGFVQDGVSRRGRVVAGWPSVLVVDGRFLGMQVERSLSS